MTNSDPFYNSACPPSLHIHDCLSAIMNGHWLPDEKKHVLLLSLAAARRSGPAHISKPYSNDERAGYSGAPRAGESREGVGMHKHSAELCSCCGADVMKNVRTVQYEELSEEQIRAARMRRSRDRWTPI